jgi:tetratricopeptide (TPR) repeat protein
MNRRAAVGLVALLLLANTASGVSRIVAFAHRHQAERALESAQVDRALVHLGKASWWTPGDEPNYLLMGQVVQQALANGLPLSTFEGRQTLEVFGFGLASVAHGIALNPADAWAWFNLASLHQSVRTATERLAVMKRAGEAALRGEAPTPPEPRQGLDALDIVSLAAARQALRLEPEFFFYHDFMADLYWKRGMIEPAAREIRASLALTPSLYAHGMMNNEEFVRALAEPILEGLEEAGRSRYVEKLHFLRARAGLLEKLERWDQAAASYEEMRSLGGQEVQQESDVAVARVLQKQKRWRESLEPLGRAVRAGTGTVWGGWALYYTGEAQSNLGDHDAARATFEKYLVLVPGSVGGYEALVRELDALGRGADAEAIAIAAVRRFPHLPHLYLKVVELMRSRGRFREAIPYAVALRKVGEDQERADRLIRELEQEARSKAP